MSLKDKLDIWLCYLRESFIIDEGMLEELKEEFSSIDLSGEYWYEGSNLVYADGDIGDMNHEGIVIDYATRIIADGVGMDGESISFDDIVEYLNSEYEWGDSVTEDKFRNLYDDGEYEECVILVIGDSVENRELVNVANDRTDVRKYAIEKWNWIAIRGNSIEMKTLDRDNFKRLYNALGEAADDSSLEFKIREKLDDIINDENFKDLKSFNKEELVDYIFENVITFGVSTYSGKSYTVTLDDLKKGNIMGMQEDPNKTKGNKPIIHPDLHKDINNPISYYKDRPIGDSVDVSKNRFDLLVEKYINK